MKGKLNMKKINIKDGKKGRSRAVNLPASLPAELKKRNI